MNDDADDDDDDDTLAWPRAHITSRARAGQTSLWAPINTGPAIIDHDDDDHDDDHDDHDDHDEQIPLPW